MALELPAEAAPLSPQSLLHVLRCATSTETRLGQSATAQLQTWETRPGYFPMLRSVFLDASMPLELRNLAIILQKNGVDKYWRRSAPNALAAADKAVIRKTMVKGGVDVAESTLNLMNSVAIAKMVRIDYPHDWPDVLTELVATLRSLAALKNDVSGRLFRALHMLVRICRELATAKLRRSQTSLQATTPELVYVLRQIYQDNVAVWTAALGGAVAEEMAEAAAQAMRNSLTALKALRTLLVVGYEYPHHHSEVREIWAQSQQHFGQFLGIMRSDQPPETHDIIGRHLLQFGKLHVNMSTAHPAAFALLPGSLELVRSYWDMVEAYGETYAALSDREQIKGATYGDSTAGKGPVMERMSTKGLVLLRQCIKMVFSPAHSFKYRTAEAKEEQRAGVQVIKAQLLSDELVRRVAQAIVTRFFRFRPLDLEAWAEEPDEWELREEGASGGDTWEFELRACAEKLFVDLVINYKALLEQPLLGLFASVVEPSTDVLARESVYTAMGLAAPVVHANFDFDGLLAGTLVAEVQRPGDSGRVLRRRVAILLGQWVTVKIDKTRRPLVYDIFRHLLDVGDAVNDVVVRVTAARQLKTVIDDFDFVELDFRPYAADILGALSALVQEVDGTETKMAVLDTLRVVCTRLEEQVVPYADAVAQLLPALWEASGEQHLMKQAIVTLLTALVAATKGQSTRLHGLVLPLIQRAIVSGSELQVYLLDEALELWAAVLQHTVAPASADLTALAEHLLPLLERGSETLRSALQILESYILLAPEAILGAGVRERVLGRAAELLGTSKRDLAGLVTSCVEQMILAAEQLGGREGVAAVAADLVASGYAQKVLRGLHDAAEAHASTGPSSRRALLDDVVQTDFLTVLARVALASPADFSRLLSTAGDISPKETATEEACAQVWAWLAPEWFRHFDAMASLERQKLSCLGLTRLLTLPGPQAQRLVRGRLQDYLAMWTAVLTEVRDGRVEGEGGLGDNLVWSDEGGVEAWASAEDARRRAGCLRDAVHRVDTMSWVREALAVFVDGVGGPTAFAEWLADVDVDVVRAFERLG